jgi:PAS domain S-box-containing protein
VKPRRSKGRGENAAALRQRYETVMGAINESVYDWDIAGDRFWTSESMQRLLGLPPEHLTLEGWRKSIHPDDYARFRDATVAHLKGETERFECDYRFRSGDGSWHWARTHGLAVRERSGRAVRMVGSTGDITELKHAEQALKQSEERYALATRAATEGIYEWNVETGALYISERARELFGLPPGNLKNTDWTARIHPDDLGGYRTAIIEHLKGRTPGVECEYRARDAAGNYRWVLDRGQALRGADGRAVRLIGAEADITQRKQALEQQTATAEILKVMSSSPADVKPVFEAIMTNALRLCEASFAAVFAYDGEYLQNVARRDASPEFARFLQSLRVRPSRETTTRRCALERRTIHTADLLNDPEFSPPQAQRSERVRTALSVPMIREGVLVGVITLWRPEVRPFTDKQIALVETFADQAVIAIENVRLFNETREALEQQKAIAEVLGVVTQLQTDVQPVFEAIGRNAARLCGALFSCVYRFDGELIHLVATHNLPAAATEVGRTLYPMRPDRSQLSGRAVLTRSVQRLEDAAQDADYATHVAVAGGWHRLLAVPMLREAEPLGVIAVGWRDPGPIPEPRVELLKTFADQAVIAIEKVRLLNETQEALEQQKALAGVLGTISRSVADTKPVFDLILDSCQRLFEGHLVGMTLADEAGMVRLGAYQGENKEAMERVYPYPLGRDSGSGQAILDRKVAHFPDVDAPGSHVPQRVLDGARAVGFKSIVFAPLVAEGEALGALWVGRRVPGPFSEREIALLETFADQAVIAIQNARLFNETKEALEQQTATADILRVISSSSTDTKPVFDAIVQSGLKLFSDAAISVALPDGDQVRAAAVAESDPARAASWRSRFPFPLTREYMHGVAILDRKVVDLADVQDAPLEMAAGSRNFLASGYRAITIMPMMHGEEAIGALSVVRLAPGPLSEKQLGVLKTFADQAVIAIENVRLFNETREALEQQKAAGEVLHVISSSIADTGPVFDKILESCERLFAGRIVGLNLVQEDGLLHIGAYHGAHREAFERIFPIPVTRESGSGLSIVERRVVHYPDAENGADVPARTRQGCRAIGIKSVIFAPLLWEGRGVGAIFVGRDHVSSFSEKEIGLLKTFADQAVIAIQNARLFREINEKSQQLEIANRHKSEFLANMSHELRTPLNAIIGFTRIVMRRSKDELEARQYENLEKIHSSGQHLLQLINAILDLSKVEAGRVEVNAADVALQPVLEQCAKTVEPLLKAPAVRLIRDFDGTLPQVHQDEEKLRQIVINLLSNAVKFTERGTVRLQARGNGASFSITVADSGIGIPPDKLEHVFEEFAQADASSTRVYGGTGLGLTIARRLARLMGGDIAVHSAPGAGSSFTLTLPVRYPG